MQVANGLCHETAWRFLYFDVLMRLWLIGRMWVGCETFETTQERVNMLLLIPVTMYALYLQR